MEMDKHEKCVDKILNVTWKEEKLNQGHKKDLIEYLDVRKIIDNSATGTLRTDTNGVLQLSRSLKNKPFIDATQDDIIRWDKEMRGHYKHTTVGLYEQRCARFLKYIYNKDVYKKGKKMQKTLDYPDCIAWVDTTITNGDELPIDEILTEKDIKLILDKGCNNAREQAIIVTLLDGGLRESELSSLKVKSVGFDPKLGAYFILPGQRKYKTRKSQRKVQLFLIPSSTLYIKEFLNHHKFKDDPEAPFFYTIARQMADKRRPIREESVYRLIKRISSDCNLKKNITPHILRHNSCTQCAMKGFNEAMMRERFGWSRSSKMPSHYTHIASKDTSDYIKKLLGIKEDITPEDSILQPILCPNCEYENVPTNVVCGRCGMKLNIKAEDLGVTAVDTGLAVQRIIADEEKAKEIFETLLAQAVKSGKVILKK